MNDDTDIDISSQYAELFEGKQKKIACPYELVFNISAYLMEENESGEDMSSKQVCGKNYHIPVKDGADPQIFMDAFFSYLENCLTESAKLSYQNSESTNKKNV